MGAHRAFLACLACSLLLYVSSPSQADQFDDAHASFESGDTKRGVEILNSIAEAGDAATQYRVGTELINYDDAGMRWIESAAEHGYAPAQADMGLAYSTGTIVAQDLPRGFMWYYLALQGDLDASTRERTKSNAKQLYTTMTSKERQKAEQLIKQWKPE